MLVDFLDKMLTWTEKWSIHIIHGLTLERFHYETLRAEKEFV